VVEKTVIGGNTEVYEVGEEKGEGRRERGAGEETRRMKGRSKREERRDRNKGKKGKRRERKQEDRKKG